MGFLKHGNVSFQSFEVTENSEPLSGGSKPFHVPGDDFHGGRYGNELWAGIKGVSGIGLARDPV